MTASILLRLYYHLKMTMYLFINRLEAIPSAHFRVLLAIFHCQLMSHLHKALCSLRTNTTTNCFAAADNDYSQILERQQHYRSHKDNDKQDSVSLLNISLQKSYKITQTGTVNQTSNKQKIHKNLAKAKTQTSVF